MTHNTKVHPPLFSHVTPLRPLEAELLARAQAGRLPVRRSAAEEDAIGVLIGLGLLQIADEADWSAQCTPHAGVTPEPRLTKRRRNKPAPSPDSFEAALQRRFDRPRLGLYMDGDHINCERAEQLMAEAQAGGWTFQEDPQTPGMLICCAPMTSGPETSAPEDNAS